MLRVRRTHDHRHRTTDLGTVEVKITISDTLLHLFVLDLALLGRALDGLVTDAVSRFPDDFRDRI